MLALSEGVEDFVVYCDASISGMGIVLMQRGYMIAYASTQPSFEYWYASLSASIWEEISDSHLLGRGRAASDGWH